MLQPLKRQLLTSRPRLPISPHLQLQPRPHHTLFSTSPPRSSFWSDLTSSFKSKSSSTASPATTLQQKPAPQTLNPKLSSETKNPLPSPNDSLTNIKATKKDESTGKRKTVAQADAELLAKLEGISGEGGASGVEYEDGKASGLKRGVKDNMFRVI